LARQTAQACWVGCLCAGSYHSRCHAGGGVSRAPALFLGSAEAIRRAAQSKTLGRNLARKRSRPHADARRPGRSASRANAHGDRAHPPGTEGGGAGGDASVPAPQCCCQRGAPSKRRRESMYASCAVGCISFSSRVWRFSPKAGTLPQRGMTDCASAGPPCPIVSPNVRGSSTTPISRREHCRIGAALQGCRDDPVTTLCRLDRGPIARQRNRGRSRCPRLPGRLCAPRADISSANHTACHRQSNRSWARRPE
jgi:hypothetical protein